MAVPVSWQKGSFWFLATSALGHVGVEQHGQGHGLVVAAGLGIIENPGYHLVVLGTEHEGHIVESLAGNQPESFWIDFQNFLVTR